MRFLDHLLAFLKPQPSRLRVDWGGPTPSSVAQLVQSALQETDHVPTDVHQAWLVARALMRTEDIVPVGQQLLDRLAQGPSPWTITDHDWAHDLVNASAHGEAQAVAWLLAQPHAPSDAWNLPRPLISPYKNRWGAQPTMTALHAAVMTDAVASVNALVAAGADPMALDPTTQQPPWAWASTAAMGEALLAAGASPALCVGLATGRSTMAMTRLAQLERKPFDGVLAGILSVESAWAHADPSRSLVDVWWDVLVDAGVSAWTKPNGDRQAALWDGLWKRLTPEEQRQAWNDRRLGWAWATGLAGQDVEPLPPQHPLLKAWRARPSLPWDEQALWARLGVVPLPPASPASVRARDQALALALEQAPLNAVWAVWCDAQKPPSDLWLRACKPRVLGRVQQGAQPVRWPTPKAVLLHVDSVKHLLAAGALEWEEAVVVIASVQPASRPSLWPLLPAAPSVVTASPAFERALSELALDRGAASVWAVVQGQALNAGTARAHGLGSVGRL